MSRPAVSVVMPFAGDAAAAAAALAAVRSLMARPGDELIVADNCGALSGVGSPPADTEPASVPVRVVRATGESSPAHARNAGAAEAGAGWILFLDADCRPPAALLDDFFAAGEPGARVGAVAGEVEAALEGAAGVAARYGVTRDFLSQRAHLAHPYLPRAVAANLLVRAAAFRELGGFTEGLRAAEDTDFCWRLQQAGWSLDLRPQARVRHLPRTTLAELRRQWRGYAAGRAWLSRRYPDFRPQPALARGVRRLGGAIRGTPAGATSRPLGAQAASAAPPARRRPSLPDRLRFTAIDVVLALEELRGLAGSNRPAPPPPLPPRARVAVAVRYPADSPAPGGCTRVEALARTAAGAPGAVYAEDDGLAERVLAWLRPRADARDRSRRMPQRFASPTATRCAPLAAMARRVGGAELVPLPDPDSRRLAEALQGAASGMRRRWRR